MNSDFVLATHALVFLNHKKDVINSEALAQNICTSPVRVRRVMTHLSKAGLVKSRRGRAYGGYYFNAAPEDVTLSMVAKAIDACFVSTDWRSGEPHMDCRVASGISGVMDGIYEDLNQVCLKRLGEITIDDIDLQLFQGAQPS